MRGATLQHRVVHPNLSWYDQVGQEEANTPLALTYPLEGKYHLFVLFPLSICVPQIVDFLNVSNEPVLGYAPPTSVTTLHLHLWSCSLDYR